VVATGRAARRIAAELVLRAQHVHGAESDT
jgi:hypothetical protein